MRKVETISWRHLFGNKLSKSIEPAMTTERGYIKQQCIRKIGDISKTIYNVVYDRDYLSEYIFIRICKPLFVLGKQEVLNLVEQSWDSYYGENAVVLPSKREVS